MLLPEDFLSLQVTSSRSSKDRSIFNEHKSIKCFKGTSWPQTAQPVSLKFKGLVAVQKLSTMFAVLYFVSGFGGKEIGRFCEVKTGSCCGVSANILVFLIRVYQKRKNLEFFYWENRLVFC